MQTHFSFNTFTRLIKQGSDVHTDTVVYNHIQLLDILSKSYFTVSCIYVTWGKGIVRCWLRKKCVPTENSILVQASKVLSTVPTVLIFMVKPICQLVLCCKYSQRKNKWENDTCECVKWLKGAEH